MGDSDRSEAEEAVIWALVLGWPQYEASSDGRLRHCSTGFERILSRNKNGYVVTRLKRGGRQFAVSLHRVVWAAFNGPIPEGHVVHHKNHVRDDNRLENLIAITFTDNILEAIGYHERWGMRPGHKMKEHQIIRGERQWQAKLTPEIVRLIRASAKTDSDLAAEIGVKPATVWYVRQGRTWKHVK